MNLRTDIESLFLRWARDTYEHAKWPFRGCNHCKRVFLPLDNRALFCTNHCRWDFHNKRKLATLKAAKNGELK